MPNSASALSERTFATDIHHLKNCNDWGQVELSEGRLCGCCSIQGLADQPEIHCIVSIVEHAHPQLRVQEVLLFTPQHTHKSSTTV